MKNFFKSRYLLLVVASVCLGVQISRLQIHAEKGDGTQLLAAGIYLSQQQVYAISPDGLRYSRREPFIPFLIAGMDKLANLFGFGKLPLQCSLRDLPLDSAPMHMNHPSCYERYSYYRIINSFFIVGTGIVSFAIIEWLTGSCALAYLAFFMTAFQSSLLRYSDRFLSEATASFLLIALSALLFAAVKIRRKRLFFAVGLVLACLALTKAIFHYLCFILPMLFVALYFLEKKSKRSPLSLRAPLFFLLGYFVLVGPWMLRNVVNGYGWVICAGRAGGALAIRSGFSQMTDVEKWAAWRHFSPLYAKPEEITKLAEVKGYSVKDIDKIFRKNPLGYYEVSRNEQAVFNPEILPPDPVVAKAYQQKQIRRLWKQPWNHLYLTLLFSWRGVFMQQGWGYDRRTESPTLGQKLGFDPWALGFKLTRFKQFYLNLFMFSLFCLLPLFYLWKQEWEKVFLFLPALYSHALYSFVSQFLPRYGLPELSLIVIATLLSFFLTFNRLKRVVCGFL